MFKGKRERKERKNKNWRKSARNVKKDKKKNPPRSWFKVGPAKVKFQKILMNATK